MFTEICLNKLNGIAVREVMLPAENRDLALTVQAEFMNLGYIMDQELLNAVADLDRHDICVLVEAIIPFMKHNKGADVVHKPMYPNFPQQVMEASDMELFMNAYAHYVTGGHWKPDYEELPREFAFENVNFIELHNVTSEEYLGLFTKLLNSADSLSDYDKRVVEYMLEYENHDSLVFPEPIPFKENMVMVAKYMIEHDQDITPLVKTATDVLRIITHLNGGDVSLATNTKFKSLPRKQRRMFTRLLEGVISEEDIRRHKNKWVRLFHNLHVGEYSNKVLQVAKKARNNKPLYSVNAAVETCLNDGHTDEAVKMLTKRPGEFARRLDYVLRTTDNHKCVIEGFSRVAQKVSTRVLLQVAGHFNYRFNDDVPRVAFPKGQVQKAVLLPKQVDLTDISDAALDIINVVNDTLVERFKELPSLGKVYLDDSLKGCPLPTQQRSVSEGANLVARGTHMPIGEKNTLRFFIYWKGQDIDLSATFHDENFEMIERVAYTNLRSKVMEAYHSGDITRAPNGASEFIDINLDMVPPKVRYIAMNVLVYSGPNFVDHEVCYAGWMTRSKPNSNEIYDPKTVDTKVDLTAASRNAIPVVFDVVNRKAIWCDLMTGRNVRWNSDSMQHYWNPMGNNVENNKASIEDVLKAITTISRTTLHDLFSLHATARAVEVVADKEEADTVFSLDGGIGPKDINVINSDYVSD